MLGFKRLVSNITLIRMCFDGDIIILVFTHIMLVWAGTENGRK
jgi:hypothetical protein